MTAPRGFLIAVAVRRAWVLRLLTALTIVLAWTSLPAQVGGNAAVLNVFRRAEPTLVQGAVWRRVQVSDNLDLVVTFGTPSRFELDSLPSNAGWGRAQRIGLFLQERDAPGRVFTLTVAPGPDACLAGLVRVTAAETVISCREEKSERFPNQKFVYDIRAKRLIKRIAYNASAFTIGRRNAESIVLTPVGDGPVDLEFSPDRTPEFRLLRRPAKPALPADMRSELEKLIEMNTPPPPFKRLSRRFGLGNAFELVERSESIQCDGDPIQEILILETLRNRQREHRLERRDGCQQIGPWQFDGDTLWFGKSFYAGEGRTGVGGFGFFDASARRLRTFSPPEMRKHSVSALLVQSDAIWFTLAYNGEWGAGGLGVLRYDRRSETFKQFEIGQGVGSSIGSVGDAIVVTADYTIAVIRGNTVKTYFLDQTTDGRWRVSEGVNH